MSAGPLFSEREIDDFREMAAHRDVVEDVIAESNDEEPASRSKVMQAIQSHHLSLDDARVGSGLGRGKSSLMGAVGTTEGAERILRSARPIDSAVAVSAERSPRRPSDVLDGRIAVVRSIPRWGASLPADHDPQWLDAFAMIARRCPLWWVAPSFVDLVDAASEQMPPDSVLVPEMVPEPFGLAFFGRPVTRGLGNPDEFWWFNGLLWAEGAPDESGEHAMWFALLTAGMSGWRIIGDSMWRFGERLDAPLYGRAPADQEEIEGHETNLQDRRLAVALWLLSTQKGVSEQRVVDPDRAAARRSERKGLPTQPYRLLDLRRSSGAVRHLGGSVDWSHRWIVRGHWRQQPHGEGRKHRRPVWIAPHIKGPEDKPLDTREGIRVATSGRAS